MKIIILLTLLLAVITAHKLSNKHKFNNKDTHSHNSHAKTAEKSSDYTKILDPNGAQKKIPSFAELHSKHGTKSTSESEGFVATGWWGDEWFEDYDPLCQWVSDDYIESLVLSCHCFGWMGLSSNEGTAKN